MKHLILLLILNCSMTVMAQKETILAAIQVTYSSSDNIEDTRLSIDADRYLVFDQENDTIDFVNVSLKQKKHSIGSVNNLKRTVVNQNHTVYIFEWDYGNNYNNVYGLALVRLDIVKKNSNQEYDQAIKSIIDDEGLNLLYRGIVVYYRGALAFEYNFEKKTANK